MQSEAKLTLSRLVLGGGDALDSLSDAVLVEALLSDKEVHNPLHVRSAPLYLRQGLPGQHLRLCSPDSTSGTGIALYRRDSTHPSILPA